MEKTFDTLAATKLFGGIRREDMPRLLACLAAEEAHYARNQPVFLAGETIHRFGVVLSGQVQVVQDDYYGNRSILARFGAGELFAESFACAGGGALPVSVYAAAESGALLIDCRRLAAPCAQACAFHTQIIRNLMGILAEKNVALTRKIQLTGKRTTREKLLAYLTAEAAKAGSPSFDIPFDRQELADYLSVERSAMSAELSKLRKAGLLRYRKCRFELTAGDGREKDGVF
jgi:CRP/FNR family transcriptional regulator, dissimilatory nitrate respiration regulator